MTLTIQAHFLLRRGALVLLGLCCVAGLAAWRGGARLATVSAGPVLAGAGRAGQAAWPSVSAGELAADWTVFAGVDEPGAGAAAGRFRLAGTFFSFDPAQQARRRAILDDVQAGRQLLVGEGDVLDGIRVLRISQNRVVLVEAGRELVLWLSFRDGPAPGSARAGPASASLIPAGLPGVEDNRFGKRIGENRWVLSRGKLMGYYEQLLSDPGRLAAVFASLKPLYNGPKISGYHLDVEGEQDFFSAVGLAQDDIVRRVNSMPMTSRRRAEFFIREFVENRANAIVLDIERAGKPEKLVYLVR